MIQHLTSKNLWGGGGTAKVVELSTTMQEDSGSNPSGKKLSDGICKYLPHLSLSYTIIVFDCWFDSYKLTYALC